MQKMGVKGDESECKFDRKGVVAVVSRVQRGARIFNDYSAPHITSGSDAVRVRCNSRGKGRLNEWERQGERERGWQLRYTGSSE